jgi:hypothetical protein
VRWLLLGFVLLGCGPESSVIASAETTQGSSTSAGPTTTGSSSDTGSSSTSTTNATADADTSTTEPDNEFETGGFIPVEPRGSGSIECDIWAQDCKASDKCQAWANDGGTHWNAVICALVDKNPAALGESCVVLGNAYSGIDTCDGATMCWNVEPDTNAGTCVARCSGSEANPWCADGLTCFVSHEGVINLCVPGCDPLAPSCADGFACVLSSFDVFGCIPAAIVPSEPDSPCEHSIGCGTGLSCTPATSLPSCDGSSCCAALCDTAIADACVDPRLTCAPLIEEGRTPRGLENVGVCRFPA